METLLTLENEGKFSRVWLEQIGFKPVPRVHDAIDVTGRTVPCIVEPTLEFRGADPDWIKSEMTLEVSSYSLVRFHIRLNFFSVHESGNFCFANI